MKVAEKAKVMLRASYGYPDAVDASSGFFDEFTELFDSRHGQSRTVLLHRLTNTVWKEATDDVSVGNASGKVLGKTKPNECFPFTSFITRLVRYSVEDGLISQEYVEGDSHVCAFNCSLRREIERVTGFSDMHAGNYKIVGNEIVIFDFEA